MQIGFDLDWADPRTGVEVPWAAAETALIQDIRHAAWKIVDVETTELNPASTPISFSGRDLRRGVDPTPRLRIVSVLFPDKLDGISVVSFDLDRVPVNKRGAVCDATLTGDVFAHNAGFDLGWLRTKSKVTPKRVLDTMLIARVMVPQQPLLLAALANDEAADEVLRTSAIQSFEQERSGWSLADLSLTVLRHYVSKALQGPRNWCEPFLPQANYDYATNDVRLVYDLLVQFFGLQPGESPVAGYERAKASRSVLSLIEPQVLDIVRMREKGMPWKVEDADAYVAQQKQKVRDFAQKMVELEPALKEHQRALADFDEGITVKLKEALGEAFRNRGLVLETTEKTAQPKIGEKDLRRAKATLTPEAKPLFDAWTGLCRAKKAGQMANDFSGYARRSPDGRIHSNIAHGPATGRLASSEPNVQQSPRDQLFRNAVRAGVQKALGREGEVFRRYKIVACDYSALDMRVGAALAIRAQRQILEAYEGRRKVTSDVKLIIKRVFDKQVTLGQAERMEKEANDAFNQWREKREEYQNDAGDRKYYWERWRELSREALLARFRRCLSYVRMRAEQAGTPEWGSLRDAFSIPGMDIHTWTALAMEGTDPLALFKGKADAEVVAELKTQKKRLGDRRQSGKVANLSLTYAMKAYGFQDSAARVHNIHWTLEEADEVRNGWLATYVEVDLWHCWTELNPHSQVFIPDPDRGNKFVRKQAYESITLAGRLIYAFGLNAALAYEDQSTGADILGTAMNTYRVEYPQVDECIVNQVHDEIVFEVPEELAEEYTGIISRVMLEAADQFLGPYGVRCECSPAVGDVWIKD